MAELDVISLTRDLLNFNTINPPGNEAEIAQYIGNLLSTHGFQVNLPEYEKKRLHLVAEKGVGGPKAPLVFSGHFDTVPLGDRSWTRDPFAGEMDGNKIYGRGSSNMKSGLAEMIIAAIESMAEINPEGGIRLIFSAGDELGCQGVQQLINTYKGLWEARAVIVGEPTANIPAIGHKGALDLNAVSKGKTAHSSMSEMGENAIYKAAKCISRIEEFRFGVGIDLLLGLPTINVGKMQGGMNLNSVPDHAEFSIDVRSTTMIEHDQILEMLIQELGEEAMLETLFDLNPVSTQEEDPFVQLVYDVCKIDRQDDTWPRALPYTTDGSVLQRFYGGVPTIILGLGEPGMAHKTDEYCSIKKLNQAVSIYKNIILIWRNENERIS
ncbi:MAG: M20 family metallopeptidase [Bacteroidota bacterium]